MTQRDKNGSNYLGHAQMRDSQVIILGSEQTWRRLDEILHLKYEVFFRN